MPSKAKANHDDAKSETASVKNGHSAKDKDHTTGAGTGGGKLRRVASSTGAAKDKDSAAAANAASAAAANVSAPASAAATTATGLQWSSFDRDILHDLRREYRLDTPAAFSNPYHQWVLSRPGIGQNSPSMTRRRRVRRQSKDELAKTVRKHFNSQGVQENDVIVGLLHKVRNPGVARLRRNKEAPHFTPLP